MLLKPKVLLFIGLLLFSKSFAFEGPLGEISRQVYKLSERGRSCQEIPTKDAKAALNKTLQVCAQQKELESPARTLQRKAYQDLQKPKLSTDRKLFGLLSTAQSTELSCLADFAQETYNSNEMIQALADKFKALRELSQSISRNASVIEKTPSMGKTCPEDVTQLLKSPATILNKQGRPVGYCGCGS